MGFTALDGLPMGTRPGQIDPGVVLYLLAEKGMSADAVQDFLYQECGLKGLSGISNDMRELLDKRGPGAALRDRLFRLSHRALRGHAGGGARRARRLRVHRGDRRELGRDPRAHRREARPGSAPSSIRTRMPGGDCCISRPDSRVATLCGADRRGTDDRAAHLGCAIGRRPRARSRDSKRTA